MEDLVPDILTKKALTEDIGMAKAHRNKLRNALSEYNDAQHHGQAPSVSHDIPENITIREFLQNVGLDAFTEKFQERGVVDFTSLCGSDIDETVMVGALGMTKVQAKKVVNARNDLVAVHLSRGHESSIATSTEGERGEGIDELEDVNFSDDSEEEDVTYSDESRLKGLAAGANVSAHIIVTQEEIITEDRISMSTKEFVTMTSNGLGSEWAELQAEEVTEMARNIKPGDSYPENMPEKA